MYKLLTCTELCNRACPRLSEKINRCPSEYRIGIRTISEFRKFGFRLAPLVLVNTQPVRRTDTIFSNVPLLSFRMHAIYVHVPAFCMRHIKLKKQPIWFTHRKDLTVISNDLCFLDLQELPSVTRSSMGPPPPPPC